MSALLSAAAWCSVVPATTALNRGRNGSKFRSLCRNSNAGSDSSSLCMAQEKANCAASTLISVWARSRLSVDSRPRTMASNGKGAETAFYARLSMFVGERLRAIRDTRARAPASLRSENPPCAAVRGRGSSVADLQFAQTRVSIRGARTLAVWQKYLTYIGMSE